MVISSNEQEPLEEVVGSLKKLKKLLAQIAMEPSRFERIIKARKLLETLIKESKEN